MKHHTITGGGDTRLHVLESGNPRGHAILFIHGFSQCSLSWARQLESDLAQGHRLVAMDLRGHGQSARPRDTYGDSRLWADDVDAVVRTLELDRPVLCGWSYGPLVILDYLRHHGEANVGGIHIVGGITKLGSEDALAVLTPELLALVPGFFSNDATESVTSLEALLGLCFAREVAQADLYTMLGFSASVPPFVRQALFARAFDNDDLLPTITKPVLITHGAQDRVVKTAVVDHHRRGMPHAEVQIISEAGHAPFWDDPGSFNHRLAAFCQAISRGTLVHA
jgi:non-heme chloroperoxidase